MKAPLLDEGDWYWLGVEEECDECHEKYPMRWMVLCDGGIIRCYACWEFDQRFKVV